MNAEPVLILDCCYLCHRAFHSMGQLSHHDIKTGVIYGFMRDVRQWCSRFATRRIVFAFDLGAPLRKKQFPGYKEKRHLPSTNPEYIRAKRELERQMHLLRTRYLPMCGWRNIFAAEGYEGDDIIARVVLDGIGEDPAIIISADTDLYQLLDWGDVRILRPAQGEIVTVGIFRKRYGIMPESWAEVKAIAGCSSDEIPGIKGVGEKTAIKWIRNELKLGSKAADAIENGDKIIQRNFDLVRLPYVGTPPCIVEPDEMSLRGWREMCRELGFDSLMRA